MPYNLTIFRDLIAASADSWASLKAYLMSDAGGRLIVNESHCGRYAIIHYDKKITAMNLPHISWFRSVVWDITSNRPLSIAPPKASTGEPMNVMQLQTYMEGININVYRTAADQSLQLSTRTSLGAKGKFYSKRSFAELFADCPAHSAIDFNGMCPDVSTGEYSRFASALIQHPEHRVVEQISAPKMWLVHLGIVKSDGLVIIDESQCDIPSVDGPSNGETLGAWFERISTGMGWQWRGAILKDGAGNRWRMKSSAYQMVRYLRGNTPRFAELFFSLRAQGLITTYLVYYPEQTDEFNNYEAWIRGATAELNTYYSKVFKNKTVELSAVPSYWHIHLKGLHHKYTSEMKKCGKKIRKEDAVAYMNALPVPRILFLMRAGATPGAGAEAATPGTQDEQMA